MSSLEPCANVTFSTVYTEETPYIQTMAVGQFVFTMTAVLTSWCRENRTLTWTWSLRNSDSRTWGTNSSLDQYQTSADTVTIPESVMSEGPAEGGLYKIHVMVCIGFVILIMLQNSFMFTAYVCSMFSQAIG